jgi:hypothetical protein
MLAFLHVNLPLFLSSPIRPFTINKLFPHCPLEISMSCSAFENAFEYNENINLYTHSEKIHKWDQGKCSEFQNQIDLRKIEELKKLLYEV